MTGPVITATPRHGVITLSNGSATPYEIPADPGQQYPTTWTCVVNFIDTNGDLLRSVNGTVFATKCQWLLMPADVDDIKRGYNFEAFILTDDETPIPYKLRYGKVVRREATFEYSSVLIEQPVSLLFSDDFNGRTGQPGNMYQQVFGNTTIHNNSSLFGGPGPGNGLGLNNGLFYSQSAVRVNRQTNGDSVRMQATVISPGDGKTRIGICGNTGLTAGLALELDSGNHLATLGKITGHNTFEGLLPGIADTLVNFDAWTIIYDDQTKTFSALKNTATTPALSWTDTGASEPHGQGYRYPFFTFDASLLATGPQITRWEYQDYVGG